MEWLTELAQNSEIPLLAAFALGLLTAIAPCPLATNITATAFIAKTINSSTLWEECFPILLSA
jgi:cytochrome c-type biogenesis protein